MLMLESVERAIHLHLEEAPMLSRIPFAIAVFMVAAVLAATATAAVTPHAGTFVAAATVGGEKVNINTADTQTLMTLDGVGHKVAEKIVEYREQHGNFTKPEEVRKVDGIGHGLWERNKERIVVK
jgi:competence ComEA-like helix-hairpin-helix protein